MGGASQVPEGVEKVPNISLLIILEGCPDLLEILKSFDVLRLTITEKYKIMSIQYYICIYIYVCVYIYIV